MSSVKKLRLDRRGALAIVLFVLIDGLFRTSYFHFGARAEGDLTPFRDSLFSELTSSVAMLVGFFLVALPLSRRWPIRGERWRRALLPHALGLISYSLLKTLLMGAQRAALWPLIGLGRYDYGDIPYRILMEGSLDVFGYALLVACIHVWDAWTTEQERKLHEAQLEARVAEARLDQLQAQIHPHFLFNTLNTISGVMYRDPQRADQLLSHLSALLRASLRRDRGHEVSISEEMDTLEHYLDVVRARFGDRLTVRTQVAAAAERGGVPPLLLQPLVENAVRHSVGALAGARCVEVDVAREDGLLKIRVQDDGTGIQGDPQRVVGRGLGLTNTRDRLQVLHGERASLSLRNRPEGGLLVEVSLPYREVTSAGGSSDV